MTEKQAKYKWCPFVGPMANRGLSASGFKDGMNVHQIPTMGYQYCLGSACAGWIDLGNETGRCGLTVPVLLSIPGISDVGENHA